VSAYISDDDMKHTDNDTTLEEKMDVLSSSGETPVIYNCRVDGYGPTSGIAFIPKDVMHTKHMEHMIHKHARKQVNATEGAFVSCGTHAASDVDQKPTKEWLSRRMSSNCASSGYNLRDVTSMNKFRCWYSGTGVTDTSKGQRVYRPFYNVRGHLASCDGGSGYGMISDTVMQDIKHYAYIKAGGEQSGMDPDQFYCMVQSTPMGT
tara:strand:- start:270 stop:887 length:618 start_codon:yes stop_codon:yes gene_type:complete